MSTENLYDRKALDKIREMVNNIDFCMLATKLTSKPLSVVPMSTKKVDEQGAIWFLSGADSDHNHNIELDPDIQLLYSKPGDLSFLSVYGQATITRDQGILEELYDKSDDNWFEGVEDPNLTAIKFLPREAYYWDAKYNKIVTLFKLAVGAITNSETDTSVEGRMKV